MVAPGIYPITIVRGIAFPSLIFKCLDGTVTVSGGDTDDGNGVYLPTDDFAGSAAFILNTPGPSPTYWLYFNPALAKYVISETLSAGTLTDYWGRPNTGDEDELVGGYLPHGAYVPFGIRDAEETPVDLTGKGVEAQVRRTPSSKVYLLDLNPSITDAPAGEITLPGLSTEETWALRTAEDNWDLVITDSGQRFGPYVKGAFRITDNITQPLT